MKENFFIILIISFSIGLYAQNEGVTIGKQEGKANTKSILEIVSKDKGILIPRMTLEERLKISTAPDNEAIGLLLYDLDLKSFMVWDGVSWLKLKQHLFDEKLKVEDQKLVFVNSDGVETSVGIEDIVTKGIVDKSISASKFKTELGNEN